MPNQSPALDRLFHALADPARRAMVERLSRGPAPVSELARPLPMSLPSVMQHLGVLEAAGLVRSEKLGRVRTCSIQTDTLLASKGNGGPASFSALIMVFALLCWGAALMIPTGHLGMRQ